MRVLALLVFDGARDSSSLTLARRGGLLAMLALLAAVLVACEPADDSAKPGRKYSLEPATAVDGDAASDASTDNGGELDIVVDDQDVVAVAPTDDANGEANAGEDTAAESPDPNDDQRLFTEWVEPDDRAAYNFDFNMTDQDGNELNMTSFRGKPVVMSFMFTRCSNPQMCPLLTLHMAALEKAIDDKGLSDMVQLVLITYDPEYDTPERLKKYGADRGMLFKSVKMLRGEVKNQELLMYTFQQHHARRVSASVILHNVDLYLFDKLGRDVRFYGNEIWDNNLVLADVEKLVAEEYSAEEIHPKATTPAAKNDGGSVAQ